MKLLVDRDDDERRIRIVERRRDGSRLYFDSGALYTHVAADGKNLLEYITAMERVLSGASDVLLLGTAGGALATQLSRRGVAVTAVDNWQPTFEIARRWFHLPADVECVHADALAFLRSTSRQWSAVAVDVFRGAEIPEAILMSDIGSLLASAVKPGGLIVWNVADSPRSWPAQWIAKALRLKGLTPSVMSVMEGGLVGNTLISENARLDGRGIRTFEAAPARRGQARFVAVRIAPSARTRTDRASRTCRSRGRAVASVTRVNSAMSQAMAIWLGSTPSLWTPSDTTISKLARSRSRTLVGGVWPMSMPTSAIASTARPSTGTAESPALWTLMSSSL